MGGKFEWTNQIGKNEEELALIKVEDFKGEKVATISCGINHSMAMTESGLAFSWGNNDFDQLGIGNTNKAYRPTLVFMNHNVLLKKISCGLNFSLFLSRDQNLYVFGDNKTGKLGTGFANEKQISPLKLKIAKKFIDIETHTYYEVLIAISFDHIYYFWGKYGRV